MKEYRSEQMILADNVTQHKLTDEFIFRDMANKIIHEMEFSDLQKLFTMKKVDPLCSDSMDVLRDPEASEYDKNEIHRLRHIESVLFKIKIIVF